MRQIYPDVGLLYWLERMVVDDLDIHLFTDNETPNRDTVLADLTEAAWSGYAPATVVAADWTASGVAGHVGSLIAPPVAFDNTSGGSVDTYGYFITDSTGAILVAAARFDDAPVSIPDGESHQVIPIVGDSSRFAS